MSAGRVDDHHEATVFVGRGAVVHLAAIGLASLCQFALTVGLSRRLGYDDLGLYTVGLGALLFASIATRIGLDHAALHFTSVARSTRSTEDRTGAAWRALHISAITGVVGALVLFALTPWIASRFDAPALAEILRVFAVAVPFANVVYVGSSALRGSGRPRASLVGITLFPFLSVVGAGAVLLAGGGTYLVAATTAGAFALSAVATLLLCAHEFGRPHLGGETRALLRFGSTNVLVQMSNYAIVWMGVFVLALFATSRDVGYFRAAIQLTLLLTLAVEGLGAFFAPLSSRLLAARDHEALGSVARSTARIAFFLTALPAIALVVAPAAALAPFGSRFGPALAPLVVLAVAHALSALVGPASWVLLTGDKILTSVVAKLPAIVVGLAAAWLLVPPLGILGAALATAIAIVLRAASHYLFVRGVASVDAFSPPLMRALGLFFAAVAAGGALTLWRPELAVPAAALGVLAFGSVAGRLGLTASDRRALVSVLELVRRPWRASIEAPRDREVEPHVQR